MTTFNLKLSTDDENVSINMTTRDSVVEIDY